MYDAEKNTIAEYYQRCFGEELLRVNDQYSSLMNKEDILKKNLNKPYNRLTRLSRMIIKLAKLRKMMENL